MRTEPAVDRDRLIAVLGDRYRLDVVRLAFVPFGLDSWSYVATCRDGSSAFVKLSRPSRAMGSAPPEVPLMAALADHGVPVPRPLTDRDGRHASAVDGYQLLVLEYLEGRALEQETAWPDELYGQVADLVAVLHASTTAVRHLVPRVEADDLPFLPRFEATLRVLAQGGTLPAGDGPAVERLRGLLMPRLTQLHAAIDRLRQLHDRTGALPADEVVCHTDIWGSNLLLTSDGTLHLLDWNGARLGPPEQDLFMFAGTGFFPPERFGWFLARYESSFRRVRLDAERFGLYLYRRSLDDLADFVDAIATGRTDAMGPDETLVIIEGLLAELPRIEGRIDPVRTVLADASREASLG